jgi:Kdo2-lipid IVA lauroyltransferase/acyltransferase
MFKYYIYKFGQFCVTHLPLKLSYWLAGLISDIHYLCSFRDRRIVAENLRVILPGATNISALTRDVFRNFGMYLVDFFRMAKKMDRRFIKERVTVKNLEYIDQALKKGQGVIFLTAHIGNWELGGFVLSLMGYPSMAIALPHKERRVNDFFNRQRESRGLTVVPMSQAIRRSLHTLQHNGVVALLADRDFSASGLVLDFLGRKSLIPRGAAMFAVKTGAAIVPTFLIRTTQDSYLLHIEEPIYVPRASNGQVSDETLLPIMRKYTAIIEEKIRQYPSQWLMFRKFWVEEEDLPW